MILVVEDDKSVANTICMVIRSLDLECEIAFNLKEAQTKLESKYYNIVLLDIILEDGRGEPLIAECQKLYPTTKIVIMSAMPKKEIDFIGKKYKIKNLLTKPFTIDNLEKFVC